MGHGLWSPSMRRSLTQTEPASMWRAGPFSTLCCPLTLRRQDQTPGRRHTIQEDTRGRARVLTATRVGEQAMSFGSETPNMQPRVSPGLGVPSDANIKPKQDPSDTCAQYQKTKPKPNTPPPSIPIKTQARDLNSHFSKGHTGGRQTQGETPQLATQRCHPRRSEWPSPINQRRRVLGGRGEGALGHRWRECRLAQPRAKWYGVISEH